jgi:hypothetical protein
MLEPYLLSPIRLQEWRLITHRGNFTFTLPDRRVFNICRLKVYWILAPNSLSWLFNDAVSKITR